MGYDGKTPEIPKGVRYGPPMRFQLIQPSLREIQFDPLGLCLMRGYKRLDNPESCDIIEEQDDERSDGQ